MDEAPLNWSHSMDLFDPADAKPVTILGAGSIGSLVTVSLARIGVTNITVWDRDEVSSHNIPMSAYYPKHVGMFKVHALKELVYEQTGVSIKAIAGSYQGEVLRNTTVVSCVDTMESGRKVIWREVKDNPSIPLLCDSRIGAAYIELFSVEPCCLEDIAMYEKTLFDDNEALRQSCGMHGLHPFGMRQAAAVVSTVIRFWQTGQKPWRVGERCDILKRVF